MFRTHSAVSDLNRITMDFDLVYIGDGDIQVSILGVSSGVRWVQTVQTDYNVLSWKLKNWIPLIPIAKSLYPLWTLLIFSLILSFGYTCWIPTNKSSLIDRARKFKIILAVWFLQSTFWYSDWYILDTFLEVSVRLN